MSRVYVPNLEHIPYAVRPFAGWPSALPSQTSQPRQPSSTKVSQATPQKYVDVEEAKVDTDKNWQDYILDYTDPYEINSLLDVLVNEAALNKKYKRSDDKPGFDLADIAQRVTAGVDLVKRAYVRPVQELGMQGFAAAGINMLQGLETMDVLANPVKGALIEGFQQGSLGAAWEGFKKGAGMSAAGRPQYDFDILPDTNGDFLLNMAAEVVADPFTWLTLGIGAAKSVVAAPLKPLIKGTIVGALDDVAGETVKQSAKLINEETLDTIAKTTAKVLQEQRTTVAEAVWRGINAAKLPANEVTENFAIQYAAKISNKLQQVLLDNATLRTLTALNKINKITNSIEAGVFAASAPVLPIAWRVLKPAVSNAAGYVVHQVNEALKSKAVLNNLGYVSIPKMALAQQIVIDRGREMFKSGMVPDDLGDEISKALYVTSHQIDMEKIRALNLKYGAQPKVLAEELDKYFEDIAQVSFVRYVELAQGLLEDYPQFQYYVRELEAELDRLRFMTDQMNRPQEYLKTLKTARDAAVKRDAELIESLPPQDLGYIRKTDTPELLAKYKAFQEALSAAAVRLKERLEYNMPLVEAVASTAGAAPKTRLPAAAIEQLNTLWEFVRDVRAGKLNETMKTYGSLQATNRYVQQLTQYEGFEDLTGLLHTIDEFIDIEVQELPEFFGPRTVAYQLKESNTQLAVDLMTLKKLQNILNNIRVLGRKAPILDEVHEQFREKLYTTLVVLAQGQQDYQVLLNQLHASGELNKYFVNAFDTLQKYKAQNFTQVLGDRDGFIDDVIEQLQIQLTSATQPKRFKLEDVLGEEKVEALRIRLKLDKKQTHTAWFDNEMVEQLFQPGEELAEYAELLTANNTVPIFLDIETFGLKGGKYPILQLHYKYDGKVYKLDVKLESTMLPDAALLETLGMTAEEFMAYYTRVNLPTEKQVLEQFLTHLRQIEDETGKQVRLVGQNLLGFDHSFLLKRLRKHQASAKDYRYLHRIQRLDSLKLLYQKYELPQLSSNAIDELRVILDKYITMRAQDPLTVGLDQHFIDTLDYGVLSEIAEMQRETARISGFYKSTKIVEDIGTTDADELWHRQYTTDRQDRIRTVVANLRKNSEYAQIRQNLIDIRNKDQYAHPGYWAGTHDYYGEPLTDPLLGIDLNAVSNTEKGLTTQRLMDLFPFLPPAVRKKVANIFPDLVNARNVQTHPIKEALTEYELIELRALLEDNKLLDTATTLELDRLSVATTEFDATAKLLNSNNELDQLQNEVFDLFRVRGEQQKLHADVKVYYDPDYAQGKGGFFNARMQPITLPNTVHAMQFFVHNPNEMYAYGFKKTFARQDLPRFYQLPENLQNNPIYLERYYSRFKQIEKAGHIVSDLRVIQPYHDLYADAIQVYQELSRQLSTQLGVPHPQSLFEHMIIPVGTLDRYALARWLHTRNLQFANGHGLGPAYAEMTRALTGGIKELGQFTPLQEMHQSVVSPEVFGMRWGGFYQSPLEIASAFFAPTKVAVWQRGDNWVADLRQQKQDLDDHISNLAILRDSHDVSSASFQAAYSVLKETQNVWDRILRYIDENSADEKQLTALLLEAKMQSELRTDGKALAELMRFVDTPAQEFADELWLYRFGLVTFSKAGGPETEVIQQAAYNRLMLRQEELAKHHIKVLYDDLDGRVWVYIDAQDPEVIAHYKAREKMLRESKQIKQIQERVFVEYEPLLPSGTSELNEIMLEAEDTLARQLATHTNGRVAGTLGDAFEPTQLRDLQDMAPDEIRKHLVPLSVWQEDLGRFSSMQFNRSNIGIVAARKTLQEYVSRNTLKNYTMSMQWLATRMENQFKYRYLFFDDLWKLGGPQYANLSDQELLDIVRNNRALKGARLVESKKPGMHGMRMIEYNIRSVADIRQAKELGVVLLPPQTFLEAWRGINELDQPSAFFRYMNKFIIQPMKLGYITSTGMLLRNAVDSTLKNFTMLDNPSQAVSMGHHMLETWRHYAQYKEIFHKVVSHTDNPRPVMSLKILDKIYEAEQLPMSKELFLFYHNYLETGATASISAAQKAEILKNADDWSRYVLNNVATRYLLDANTEVENLIRLTAYTWQTMNGATIDEAMQAILKTHFDYSVKSRAKMYADYVIPFFSFMEQNLMYWLRLLSEKGWAAVMFQNLMTPIWDLDRYDNQELNQNRSIQYNILAGNLVMDSGLVTKINPSVMDAMRIISDPSEAIGRVNAVARATKSYLDDPEQDVTKLIATNLPMVGPTMMRYWLSDDPIAKGSAWKAAMRVDEGYDVLPLMFPSVFGGALRLYYFAYSTGDVYSTASKDKLMEHLADGAVQVITPEDARQITATEETRGRFFFAFPGSAVYSTSSEEKLAEMLAKGAVPITLTEDLAREVLIAMRAALAAKADGWVKPKQTYSGSGYTRRQYPKYQKKIKPIKFRSTKVRLPYDRNHHLYRFSPVVFNQVMTTARGRKQRMLRPTIKRTRSTLKLGTFTTKRQAVDQLKKDWSYLR